MTENKLWPALIRARQAIQPIAKTATNPHFRNSYAPLGEVLAAVLPALHAEGLCLVAGVDVTEAGPVLRVAINGEGGQFVSSAVPLIGASDMQKLGGAMTYAMRYAVGMLLALELDEDDDGNKTAVGQGNASQATGGTPRTAPGGQGSPRPAPNPQPAPARSQGNGGGVKGKKGKCPSCGVEAVIKGKAEFGGGWLCWKKEGGCGSKFTDSVWSMVSQPGPSSLDPTPKPARHEAPADVQDLTSEDSLPF